MVKKYMKRKFDIIFLFGIICIIYISFKIIIWVVVNNVYFCS